ncbi:mitochondrial ABC transporter, partial [Tubulinosema ratisbonensis]
MLKPKKPKMSQIIKEIAIKYVFSLKIFRILVVPGLAIVIISTFLEVYKSVVLKNLVNSFLKYDLFFDTFYKFWLISFVVIFLSKMTTLIFARPCQLIYKACMVEGVRKYLKMEFLSFNKDSIGKIHSLIERRSDSTGELVTTFFTKFIHIPIILFFNFYSLSKNFNKTIFSIVFLHVFLYCFIFIYFANWRGKLKLLLNQKYNAAYDLQLEILYNYEIIKSFDKIDYECERYDKKCKETLKPGGDIKIVFYFADVLANLVFLFMDFLVILIIYKNVGEKFSLGHLSEYLLKSRIFKMKLSELSGLYGIFIINYANIYEYYCVSDGENSFEKNELNDQISFYKKIEFKNVSISLKDNL